MNQSEVVDDFRRSGYQLGCRRSGFVHLFKRITNLDRNVQCPEYSDITVFPNGRYCEGDVDKYRHKKD